MPSSLRPGDSGREGFRPDVQGLRAIAVLAVVAFHAGLPMPGGFIGVDVFFVISGFVICGMLTREWEASGRIRLAHFYVRRFKRLTPALALVVAFTVLVSALLLPPLGAQQVVASTGLWAMLLGSNFAIAANTGGYFDVAAELNPLLNIWSLSVEEQFYLVFPALLIAVWMLSARWRGGKWLPLAAVSIFALGSLLLAWMDAAGRLPAPVPDALFGFYGPAGRVWEFAAGALVALLAPRLAVLARRGATAIGVAGAALVLMSLWLIDGSTPFPGVRTLIPVLGTVLLVVAGLAPGNLVSRGLATAPMRWIGDRSYSLYLWHWPFISFAVVLWPDVPAAKILAALLAVVPALLSYRFVEAPLRSLPTPRRRSVLRLAALILVPPIALSAVLGVAADQGFWNPAVHSFQAAFADHLVRAAQCDRSVPTPDQEPGACTWNADAAGPPIYLVGDSNAGQFVEGLVDVANSVDSPLVVSTTNGCPFVDGYVHRTDDAGASSNGVCAQYRTGTIDFLRSAPPGVVVLAQISLYWYLDQSFIGPDEATATSDSSTKLAYFADRLPAIIQEFRDAGHQVLLIQQVPNFPEYEPQACSVPEIATGACFATMSLADAVSQFEAVQQIVTATAAATGSETLQLRPELCGAETCSTTVDGVVNYRDGGHISVKASHTLAPALGTAVRHLIARM